MPKIVGGIAFQDAPIMIGAGVSKNPGATWPWLSVAPVVSGSYTIDYRPGNEGAWLYYPITEGEFRLVSFGLNSFGMPNPGLQAAINEFWEKADFLKAEETQPLIISVAGFSVADYAALYQMVAHSPATACEGNFGCPNTTDHRDIMSFDLKSLGEVFHQLRSSKLALPFWAKFSPYSNPSELKRVADLVNEYADVIKAVVTCNTFPFAYAGKGKISPNDGLAGLSGRALKQIALGQVFQFRKHLKPEIDVIGVGGITTGDDVVEFFDAGAAAVQLTSLPFWTGRPRAFWEHLLESKRLQDYIEFNPK